MSGDYWRSAAEDEAMQDDHAFIWEAMIETIGSDLAGQRVLDVGCNRGGFLRMLVDRHRIGEGWGYDPAPQAVVDARRLAQGRALTFETATTVPAAWAGFDIAFSHEVLYLVRDIPAHAAAMFPALNPGGSYHAVMGVHAGSRLMADWHASVAHELDLPRLYTLDEVAAAFETAGFAVSVAQLALRFVPVSSHRHGHAHQRALFDWLDYYRRDKVLLRFTWPLS